MNVAARFPGALHSAPTKRPDETDAARQPSQPSLTPGKLSMPDTYITLREVGVGYSVFKLLLAGFVLTLANGATGSDAFAQQRDRRCAATYLERCYQACVARGGQARRCPSYCQQQQQEARCR
jgi:hypothetical protein